MDFWAGPFATDRLLAVPAGGRWGWNYANLYKITLWLSDQLIMRYSEQRHRTHSVFEQSKYVNNVLSDDTLGYWGIFLRDSDILVGTLSASLDPNNAVANLGILIGEGRGRGYGKEVWTAAIQAMGSRGVRKVEAGMMSINVPMIRLCEHAGMVQEAVIPGHFVFGEQKIDKICMGKRFDV